MWVRESVKDFVCVRVCVLVILCVFVRVYMCVHVRICVCVSTYVSYSLACTCHPLSSRSCVLILHAIFSAILFEMQCVHVSSQAFESLRIRK